MQTENTIDNWRALREALDAGPTDKPWSLEPVEDRSIKHLCPVDADGLSILTVVTHDDTPFAAVYLDADAHYIAAAHPAAIRSLLDERDRLTSDAQNCKELVWALARELKCLPSTFSDANGHVLKAAIALNAERDRLEAENAKLRTVMTAAAEEIHKHWDAHCDAEGYGPANLMRRLEDGIPSEYGYTAGAFAELRAERDRLAAEVEALRADAGRYRWLRDNPWCEELQDVISLHRNARWDAAIDAAMKGTP